MASLAFFVVASAKTLGTAQLIVGGIATALIDNALLFPRLFPGPQPDNKYDDLGIQSASEGGPVQRVFGGSTRVAGQIIWQTKLRDVESLAASYGKGGGYDVAVPQKVMSIAISFVMGEVAGFDRIWADGKLVWTDEPSLAVTDDTISCAFQAEFFELTEDPASDLTETTLGHLYPGQQAIISGFARKSTFTHTNPAGANVLFFNGAEGVNSFTISLDANGSFGLSGNLANHDAFVIDHGGSIGQVRYWIDGQVTASGGQFATVNITRDLFGGTGSSFGLAAAVSDNTQVTIVAGVNGGYNVLSTNIDLSTGVPSARFHSHNGQTHSAGATVTVTQTGQAFDNSKIGSVTVYTGTDYQTADPVIVADQGAAKTPAYRGLAYVVFEDFNVTDYGNRPPNFTARVTSSSSPLYADIVDDLIQPTGMPTGYWDATAADSAAPGFAVSGPTPPAQAIQPPMIAGNILARDVLGVLTFYPRAELPTLDIDSGDLGAALSESERAQLLTLTDADDFDIPTEVEVSFIDPNKDYQRGSVRERAGGVIGDNVSSVNLPMSMTPTEARAIGTRLLWSARAGRVASALTLPPSYIGQVGENMILMTTVDGEEYTFLAQKVDRSPEGMIAVEAITEDPETFAQESVEGQDIENAQPNVIKTASTSRLSVLDVPPLADEHGGVLGYYWAAASYQANAWGGATLYASGDSGTTFSPVAQSKIQAVMGYATTTLADATGLIWDRSGTVEVQLDTDQTLESVSELACLNGSNRALLGGEIIGWTTATLTGTRTYELSGLLRGLRDTHSAMAEHATGERFVVLGDGLAFQNLNSAGFNVSKPFKIVSSGGSVAAATAESFRLTGATMRHFKPCHVEGTRDGSDNLTVTWTRRSRRIVRILSAVTVPDGDYNESAAYEVDFLDGATVVRTKASSTPTVTYSAAEQTTDGLTPGDPVDMIIYSVSDVTGRGNGREATV